MHYVTPQYISATSRNKRLKTLPILFLSAGLILASMSPQIIAAESNYRSTEGLAHAVEQFGADLNSPPAIDTTPAEQNGAPAYDNHLTLFPEHVRWLGGDIWITDISTLLYKDNDLDGYFSGFSLSVDADTDYSHADVYATIDIQRTSGERERLHTTGRFSIYGHSLSDEFRIDIELVRNYPIDDYNLFVNLVDANDHAIVDSVGAHDISNLSRLPLESEELDNDPVHIDEVTPIQITAPNNNIRVAEHSGASSAWLLLAVGIPALMRRRKETTSPHSTGKA